MDLVVCGVALLVVDVRFFGFFAGVGKRLKNYGLWGFLCSFCVARLVF